MLVPLLRRARDFRASACVHDIVGFGALEADAHRPIFGGVALWFDGRGNPAPAQGGRQGLVDRAVTRGGPQLFQGVTARNDQRVRPVLAMIDDTSAGGTTAEIKRLLGGQLFADECDFLSVTKR